MYDVVALDKRVVFEPVHNRIEARRPQDVVRVGRVQPVVHRFHKRLEAIDLAQAKRQRQVNLPHAQRIVVGGVPLGAHDARLPELRQSARHLVHGRRRIVERARIRPDEAHQSQEEGKIKVLTVGKLLDAS